MRRFSKNILWILSFLFYVACPYPAVALDAAATAGEVSLHCPLNGGRIGDPIPFILQVQLKESAALEPSSLSRLEMRPVGDNRQNLQKEFFAFEFAPFDHLLLSAKKSFAIKGVMRFYAPGEYRLAPLSLVCRLSDRADNTSDSSGENSDKPVISTIVSNSIVVRIAGLHPADSEPSPALIIPEKEPRFTPSGLDGWPTRYRLYQYAISFSFLLVLFFGIVCYLRRKNAPAPQLKSNVGQIKEMTKTLAASLKQAEVKNHWRYLVDCDHLLRNFLLAKLKLAEGWSGGSGASFVEQISPALDAQLAARLQVFWLEIDRIIALEIKDDPGFAELRHELRSWLRVYVEEGARHGF